ncbi:MAG: metal ABC transporter permease [Gemmatimonas sp.]
MSAFATLPDWVSGPLAEPGALRRALVACLALSLGSGPVGVFLVLRRMSLIGDTMAHAILPGVAAGFLIAGMSIPVMSAGGFAAGLIVALLAGLVTRFTPVKEDASFAGLLVISLALGVLMVGSHGDHEELVDVLFGSIAEITDVSVVMIAGVATVTLVALAAIYRPLLVECFDPVFLRTVRGPGTATHLAFLVLVVLNMVASFQALGTLMAVGLMMLPAIAARFWAREVWSLAAVAVIIAAGASVVGLFLSLYLGASSGPAIVLVAGIAYLGSLAVGPRDSLAARLLRRHHLRA